VTVPRRCRLEDWLSNTMPYEVVPLNPATHRTEIVQAWREYLPDTPDSRLDWLLDGNPAGPAMWFGAFERTSGAFAGMMSIMPKRFFLAGVSISAGIMGDFVVGKAHRVFGPAHALPRAAMQAARAAGVSILYTVPNSVSGRLAQRAGLDTEQTLVCYTRPLACGTYLARRFGRSTRILGPLLDAAVRLASRDSYARSLEDLDESSTIDDRFDALWEETRRGRPHQLTSDHSSPYLRWRYLRNPEHSFRLLTSVDCERLLGYVFFKVQNGQLEIFDLLALDDHISYQLLRGLVGVGRRESCRSISMTVGAKHPVARLLRRCLFIGTGPAVPVLLFSVDASLCDRLPLSNAERNI
jgi:hypothetical protein